MKAWILEIIDLMVFTDDGRIASMRTLWSTDESQLPSGALGPHPGKSRSQRLRTGSLWQASFASSDRNRPTAGWKLRIRSRMRPTVERFDEQARR